MSRTFLISKLGVSLVAASLVAFGCSSDDTSTPNNNNNTDGGDNNTGNTVGKQPARPTSGEPTADVHTFAIDTLDLGDVNWKSLGYNIDGKVSTSQSTDVCKETNGQKTIHNDGNQGIDNAFGNKIAAYIGTINPQPSSRISDAIKGGEFTIIFETTGLSADAAQTANGVTGKVYTGGAYDPDGKKKPTFAKDDNWPVRDNLTPKATFDNGYVTNGTYVSGDPTDIQMTLIFSGQQLSITIHKAVVTFKHSAESAATGGIISGVIETAQLVSEIQKVAGAISPSFCPGSANADSLKSTIQEASDILKDGTNVAGSDCDGISVGIGFTAKEIAAPTKVSVQPAVGDPCSTD